MNTTLAAPIVALVLGGGLIIPQDLPSAGDQCTVWHAVTTDRYGNTLWCNHTMTTDPRTGQPILVWQAGGPGN